jgi:hypothetical protein
LPALGGPAIKISNGQTIRVVKGASESPPITNSLALFQSPETIKERMEEIAFGQSCSDQQKTRSSQIRLGQWAKVNSFSRSNRVLEEAKSVSPFRRNSESPRGIPNVAILFAKTLSARTP